MTTLHLIRPVIVGDPVGGPCRTIPEGTECEFLCEVPPRRGDYGIRYKVKTKDGKILTGIHPDYFDRKV